MGLVMGRAPCTKETLSGFGKIMDPGKWDSTVWYQGYTISLGFPQVDG